MGGCSPEPQKLWEDGSYEAINEDVRPHQLTGEFEGLKACVMKQEEARPQQQQVEQTHKAWKKQEHHKDVEKQWCYCKTVGNTLLKAVWRCEP